MNALDMDMIRSINSTINDIKNNKSIRVVILKGEGKAFCSGLDIMSVASNPANSKELLEKKTPGKYSNIVQDVGYLWRELPVPVIAVLHHTCYGGGLQIALGADLRFSTPDCKLSILEAKWGMVPDMSGTITLRELVRADIVKELAITGRVIDGNEAARIGMVTRVCEDPLAEAIKVAKEVITRSPDSVAATKQLFQRTRVSR